jgi:hypothetical protein
MFNIEPGKHYSLGIDPSISATGLALICLEDLSVQTRTLSTTKKIKTSVDDYRRVYELYTGILGIVNQTPRMKISIEMPPGSATNARTAKMAGMCVGMLGPLYHQITHFYNAMAIKRFVGNKDIKGPDRKLLNIEKCNELYPNHDLRRNKSGNVLICENNAADALLLAHMARVNFSLTAKG